MRALLCSSLLTAYCLASSQLPFIDQNYDVTSSDPLDADFDDLVAKTMSLFQVPGLSISIIHGNDTYAKGYGVAVFPNQKATAETLYYTGSTTKSFVAASILMLTEESVNATEPLTLTTPLSSLIREDFVLPDGYASTHATLEDALSHRTGMPRHDLSYGGPNTSTRDIVRSLRYLPMTAELRVSHQYCNMMYMVLSHVIQTITETWLGDFVRTRIWEPLSMSSSFFSLQDAQKAEADGRVSLARGYYWSNKTQQFIPEEWLDAPANSGAGGVISNVLDYAVYLRAMLNEDSRLLSEASYAQLRTPRTMVPSGANPAFTGPLTYALGWEVGVYRNVEVISHGGAVNGFGALMAYIPAKKWGVATMANTDIYSNRAEQVLWFALMDRLLETPEEERFDWLAHYERMTEKEREMWQNARERLYPAAPHPPTLPHSLPLKEYTGVYTHPAYQNITLRRLYDTSDAPLHADVLERTWPHQLNFEHVNGDHFLVRVSPIKRSPTALFEKNLVFQGEFRIAADGKVREMGLAYERGMGNRKIWFRKVA